MPNERIVILLAFAAGIVASHSAFGAEFDGGASLTQALQNAGRIYYACTAEYAKDRARGNATASEIADAALAHCEATKLEQVSEIAARKLLPEHRALQVLTVSSKPLGGTRYELLLIPE
jgi:hypothetical protein